MPIDQVHVSLPQPLAEHVNNVVGPNGYYETPGEYVRSLIRRDMTETDVFQIREAIHEGYKDIDAGRYFKSTRDFVKDRAKFEKKEAGGWI